MKKIFILILLIPCVSIADTKFDRVLIESNIIDKNYNVLDHRKLTEVYRLASNNMGEMLPMKIDNITTVLGANMNKLGIYYTYQIDGVETKNDVNNILLKNGYEENYINYLCSLDYTRSEFFKRDKKFSINSIIVNSKNQVIYSFKKPIWTC